MSISSRPDDFNRLPRAAWQLRDRRIWTFDSSNVFSLTVHQQGAARKYLSTTRKGNGPLPPAITGRPEVNWPSLEEGVHRLGELKAVYWSGPGDTHGAGFRFCQDGFWLVFGGQTRRQDRDYSIEFGGRSPYSHPYASVVRNGQRLIFEFPVDLYDKLRGA